MIEFDEGELKMLAATLIAGITTMESKLENPWPEDNPESLTKNIALGERTLKKVAALLTTRLLEKRDLN